MAQFPYIEVDLQPFRNGPSRAALRKRLLLNFANEQPGQGKKELMSRYRYTVDTLSDGSVLSITRPYGRNGLDFRIEMYIPVADNKPIVVKYSDVYNDLAAKKAANEKWYPKLWAMIEATYQCEDIKDKKLESLIRKYEGVGYPVDLLLALIRWFLIQKDMVGWNASGRDCEFYRNLPR